MDCEGDVSKRENLPCTFTCDNSCCGLEAHTRDLPPVNWWVVTVNYRTVHFCQECAASVDDALRLAAENAGWDGGE